MKHRLAPTSLSISLTFKSVVVTHGACTDRRARRRHRRRGIAPGRRPPWPPAGRWARRPRTGSGPGRRDRSRTSPSASARVRHGQVRVETDGEAALAAPQVVRPRRIRRGRLRHAGQREAPPEVPLAEEDRVEQRGTTEPGARRPELVALPRLPATGVVGGRPVDRAVRGAQPQDLVVGLGVDGRIDLAAQAAALVEALVVEAEVVRSGLGPRVTAERATGRRDGVTTSLPDRCSRLRSVPVWPARAVASPMATRSVSGGRPSW